MLKKVLVFTLMLIAVGGYSQTKNFIDKPFLETYAKIDSMVVPDRISLRISLKENDSKGDISVAELDKKMISTLKTIGIDIKKQLSLTKLSSNVKKKFIRKNDIQVSKTYSLLVYDANTASRVIRELEDVGLSNISIISMKYSKMEELEVYLREKAIMKARNKAVSMTSRLNQSIGKAIYISDMQANVSDYFTGSSSGIVVRGMGRISNNSDDDLLADIAFRKIKVESKVFVKFELK